MPNPINQPAITRNAVKELTALGKASKGRLQKGKRQNLVEFLYLGKVIHDLKDACVEVGAFTKALEEMGVDRKEASNARRLYELPPEAGVSSCSSINEALLSLKPEEDQSCPVRGVNPVSSQPAPQSEPSPSSTPWVDQGAGAHPTQAPTRAERLGIKPPTPFVPKERDAGDDTETEQADKEAAKRQAPSGSEDFSIRTVHDHFGKLIWLIGQLAHKAGCDKPSYSPKLARPLVMTPRQLGIERLLQEAQKEIEKWHAEVLRSGSKSRSSS